MRAGAETALIARREIVTQVRSRAFIIGNLAMIVLVVAGIALYSAFAGRHDQHTTAIGLTPQTAALAPVLTADAAARGLSVRIADVSADGAADQVRTGAVDLALVAAGPTVTVLSKDTPDAGLLAATDLALTRSIGAQYLRRNGIATDQYLRDTAAPLRVRLLSPADPDRVQRWVIAYFGAFILFLSIVQYGVGVCTGVVEEKSSRVVELLLATVRPIQLLAGKIGGLGVVGIVQTTVIGAVALIAGEVTHTITVGRAAPLVLGAVLLWFVLGYVLFAALFAAAGAMVSRQEDARSAIAPFNIVLAMCFYASVFGSRTDSPIMDALNWIPPFSAFLMPMRVAQGTVGPVEFVGSALIMCVAAAAVAVLAARIYERSILRIGARVTWRQALGVR